MQVVGRPWPSKQTIERLVADIDTTVVLSWGAVYPGALNGAGRVMGMDQLVKFREAGVLCPDFTNDTEEVKTWLAQGDLVFGRLNNHTQGHDIILVNAFRDDSWMGRSHYWTKVVRNVTNEWRIHSFAGTYIAQGKKVLTSSTRQPPVAIRSRKKGWTITHQDWPHKNIRKAAVAAVKALGYDFGAVDVLETTNGIYVLEVNRAPGLDNYTAGKYNEAIRNHLG